MAAPLPPFQPLADAFGKLTQNLKAPPWLVDEMQHRLVLFLNHVLARQPQAQERLTRLRGRVVRLQWRGFHIQLAATPAGLCELAQEATPDLRLTVADASPLDLARGAARGERPQVRIEGDAGLAADVNWLADNVRWDAGGDLARLIGEAPARALTDLGRKVAQALRAFVSKQPEREARA